MVCSAWPSFYCEVLVSTAPCGVFFRRRFSCQCRQKCALTWLESYPKCKPQWLNIFFLRRSSRQRHQKTNTNWLTTITPETQATPIENSICLASVVMPASPEKCNLFGFHHTRSGKQTSYSSGEPFQHYRLHWLFCSFKVLLLGFGLWYVRSSGLLCPVLQCTCVVFNVVFACPDFI